MLIFGMFAVIETGGKQYIVKEGETIKIEKIAGNPEDKVQFDRVLLVGDQGADVLKLGAPYVKDARVTATVQSQGRTPKVRVVKYKRKVRYKRVYGHRQPFTTVLIENIG